MPSTEPSSEKTDMIATIISQPRSRVRYARRAIPRSSAPVANITVMKEPIASTKRNTWAAPNSSPTAPGETTPVSASWMPYRPLTGDRSRSLTRSRKSIGEGTS